MVVKKFEARSMKEALEMVKSELGPEAIIIAARDNIKNYGLVGDGSVEITAAIQEASLQKKNFAESRMTADQRSKIHKGSSKAHKELIAKVIYNHEMDHKKQAAAAKPTPAPIKARTERTQRYIDMRDDVEPNAAPNGANEKLRIAAQKAWKAIQQSQPQVSNPSPSVNTKQPTATPQFDDRVTSLRSEIDDLKQFFSNFRDIPQNVIPSHPGYELGLRYEFSPFYEKLLAAGIEKNLLASILKEVQDHLPPNNTITPALLQGLIIKTIAQKIIIKKPGTDFKFEVFIGAGGHGKTASLIKRAAALCMQEQKRVAILSTDIKKLGADEQLKIYSQILNIPFMAIRDSSDWNIIAEEVSNFDHILIDTPGVRFRSADEMQELKRILPPSSFRTTTHLVISATSKDQDAIELGKRFASVGFDDIIFTALDESLQHGVILNFQNFIGKPFHSFGIGPKIPEDFEPATIERVIDLLISSPIELNRNSDLGF